MAGLAVNVDHIATLRQARGINYPDPVAAAVLAELAGADGIVVHLREDRRHIQDPGGFQNIRSGLYHDRRRPRHSHRTYCNQTLQHGISPVADRKILCAGIHTAGHDHRNQQYLYKIFEQGKGTLKWPPLKQQNRESLTKLPWRLCS